MTKFKPIPLRISNKSRAPTGLAMNVTAAMHVIDCRVGAALKQARLSAGRQA